MNGLGGAAGVLLGGIITEVLSWRWVLLINPPIAVAAALVAYAVVSERRRAEDGASFDLAGALTLTIGQMILVYGVVEAGLKGWDTFAALGPIVLGVVLLGLFGVIETRVASTPLIPFKELTKPLRIANTVVLLFSAALFPMWFVSSLYLQQVLGLSPLHTGLIFLPMTLTIMLVASRAGKLVSQFGVRPVLGGGLIMLTAGLLLFTRIGSSGSAIVYVIIPGVLTAAGIAMSIVPSTIAATQGAKQGQTGLASGLVNTSRQVGGGLGLALLITLATQRTTHLIGSGQQVAAGADRRLSARLPDRRRPGRAGGRDHVHLAPGARHRAWRRGQASRARDRRRPRGLRRAHRRLRGLPRRSDRGVHHQRRLQLRDRALASPAPAPRHPAGARGAARARLHLHRELLRPERTADGRPERAADPRPAPAAGVVPAGAGKARRRQPQPADLSRQAGSRLVAGRRHEHRRDGKRRRRRGRPALPDGREAEGDDRLGAHPPRVRDQRRPRLGDREQEHPDEPLQVRRRLQRRADRLGGAGVRPQDRQAPSQLGRARSHPA